MSKWEINTEELVDILKNGQPLSLGAIQDDNTGKDKLIVLFALPELSGKIESFCRTLLTPNNNDK